MGKLLENPAQWWAQWVSLENKVQIPKEIKETLPKAGLFNGGLANPNPYRNPIREATTGPNPRQFFLMVYSERPFCR